jgi:hypothetical protein
MAAAVRITSQVTNCSTDVQLLVACVYLRANVRREHINAKRVACGSAVYRAVLSGSFAQMTHTLTGPSTTTAHRGTIKMILWRDFPGRNVP